MSMLEHLALLAEYNAVMNEKLYAAAAQLPPAALLEERKAFFGSVFGTLNHLAAGDTIWLKRFSAHPARHAALDAIRASAAPGSLSAPLAHDLPGLLALRQRLDQTIRTWAAQLTEADLDHVLVYGNMKGVVLNKRFGSLVMHLFNHQTHHRGQASTLLTQCGIDIGVTDLLMLIPNQP